MTVNKAIGLEAARRLYARLEQARANNGGSLHKTEWLSIAAGQFDAELTANCKKGRVNGARDPLFDALAENCGHCLKELTKSGARAVAVAKADILAVCPEVTTDEIKARIVKYRQKHPDWPLTAPAIAKNWASLGSGDPTRTAKRDIYQEPKEWRSACLGLWGQDVGEQVFARGWLGNGPDYRAEILGELADRANPGKYR